MEEFLRLTSPVQGLARTTTRPVEIGGTEIPADKKVMLLYASANRDPREFGADAEELDVCRAIDKILTFSYGAHHCLGAAVAPFPNSAQLHLIRNARCRTSVRWMGPSGNHPHIAQWYHLTLDFGEFEARKGEPPTREAVPN